jgi:predicted signal transduction protein with EAL and GGDEF domain
MRFFIMASAGVAVYAPSDQSSEDLLLRVDHALYHAKENQSGISTASVAGQKTPAIS